MKQERQQVRSERRAGFTLMELMVVVGIIGLVAAMSVPSILQMRRQAPMVKALDDIREMCERARAGAVLKNTIATMVFEPRSGKIELVGGDQNTALTSRLGAKPLSATQFDPSVNVEQLWINAKDWTAAATAPVNFYDNGTSDEMTLILTCGGQREMVSLELSTAQPTMSQLQ
ncbi:MAG TPA: type II secretion system protein [Pseudomonadales bacterium]|nr:type II secretion system protein [Pseudomonadales bacterium]